MYVRTRSPNGTCGGALFRAPPPISSLLLDPPLIHVVSDRVRRWREVLDALVRGSERVGAEPEVIRLFVVQDLGDRFVCLLARGSPAVAVRGIAPFDDGLVQRVVLVEREAEGLLARSWDLVGMPDAVRVRVAGKAGPADDHGLDLRIRGDQLVDDALECLSLRLRFNADLLVLL